jgi:hypothetical protein
MKAQILKKFLILKLSLALIYPAPILAQSVSTVKGGEISISDQVSATMEAGGVNELSLEDQVAQIKKNGKEITGADYILDDKGNVLIEDGGIVMDPMILMSSAFYLVDAADKFQVLKGSTPEDIENAATASKAYTTVSFMTFENFRRSSLTQMNLDEDFDNKTKQALEQIRAQHEALEISYAEQYQVESTAAAAFAAIVEGVVADMEKLDELKVVCDEEAEKTISLIDGDAKPDAGNAQKECKAANVDVADPLEGVNLASCDEAKEIIVEKIIEDIEKEAPSMTTHDLVKEDIELLKKAYDKCEAAGNNLASNLSKMRGKAKSKKESLEKEWDEALAAIPSCEEGDDECESNGDAQEASINKEYSEKIDKIEKRCLPAIADAQSSQSNAFDSILPSAVRKCNKFTDETETLTGGVAKPDGVLEELDAKRSEDAEFENIAKLQKSGGDLSESQQNLVRARDLRTSGAKLSESDQAFVDANLVSLAEGDGSAGSLYNIIGGNNQVYKDFGEQIEETLGPIGSYVDLFIAHPMKRLVLWTTFSTIADTIAQGTLAKLNNERNIINQINDVINKFQDSNGPSLAAGTVGEDGQITPPRPTGGKANVSSTGGVLPSLGGSTSRGTGTFSYGSSGFGSQATTGLVGTKPLLQKPFNPGNVSKVVKSFLKNQSSSVDAAFKSAFSSKNGVINASQRSSFGGANAINSAMQNRMSESLKKFKKIKSSKRKTTMTESLAGSITKLGGLLKEKAPEYSSNAPSGDIVITSTESKEGSDYSRMRMRRSATEQGSTGYFARKSSSSANKAQAVKKRERIAKTERRKVRLGSRVKAFSARDKDKRKKEKRGGLDRYDELAKAKAKKAGDVLPDEEARAAALNAELIDPSMSAMMAKEEARRRAAFEAAGFDNRDINTDPRGNLFKQISKRYYDSAMRHLYYGDL